MLAFVLASMTALHPQATHVGDAEKVAKAIAAVAERDPPLAGMSPEATAALLVVMAWHESRFRMGVVGDHGRAFCAMQVHDAPWLAKDPLACMRAAMKLLRASAAACPDAPLAPYAGGCQIPPARWISTHRLREAAKIERTARDELAASTGP